MRLSKQEAAARLGVSTATIERRIQRGQLQAEKEAQGTRYRVWVILEDEPIVETDVATPVSAGVETGSQQDQAADATPVETGVETQPRQDQAPVATLVATPPPAEMDAYIEMARLQEQLESAQQRASSLEELADYHKQALTDSEWRYHEILTELKQSQQNLAAVTRALPAPQEVQTDRDRPRRLWWPFRKR